MGWPDVVASSYGLAVRVRLEPGRRKTLRRGPPVVDPPFLDSFSVDLETKPKYLATLLRDLAPGLREWAVHPGPGDGEARATDEGWRVRSRDLAYITSPEAHEDLQKNNIVVAHYQRLQTARTQATDQRRR